MYFVRLTNKSILFEKSLRAKRVLVTTIAVNRGYHNGLSGLNSIE